MTQDAGSAFTATGMIWGLCFQNEALVRKLHACPIPWEPAETARYRKAGYTLEPKECGA